MTETDALTIRVARRDDFAAVDALLARSYPALLKRDYPPSVMVTAVPRLARARPELLRCGSYYVAETAMDQIVAAGGWTPKRRGRGLAEIRHVVTDHRRVREGIGKQLLTHAMNEARRLGVTRFEAMATRTAVPFYQSLGFVPLGAIEITLDHGITFPAIQMHLDDGSPGSSA
ncbi:MAG: GNAT family N-acetyltransferase [Pseudomonadota bacterium]